MSDERRPTTKSYSGTGPVMTSGIPTMYGKHLALPVHETAVCPECGWAGVTMRGEECRCHRCDYRWRWPLTIDLGMD